MKSIVKYIAPNGNIFWEGYGPMVLEPQRALSFVNEVVAEKAALNRLGRGDTGFWESERKHFNEAARKYRGWDFEVMPYDKSITATREEKIAGEVGRKIVGLDIDDLMDYLQTAYCDEWLAYHQYWIGAKIVEGQMRPSVQKELEEHAEDEEKHADMIAERIIQLGGTPVLDPQEWKTYGKCGFSAPTNVNVIPVLEQNVKAEQCAIEFYNELLQIVCGVDEVTAQMVREILKDEVEHEEDLQMLQRDLSVSKTAKLQKTMKIS